MTEAERFLDSCAGRGRMTLPDHLTLYGVEDRNKRRAITLQVNKLLTEQKYSSLVGTVITHDQDARGMRPKWAENAPTQKNKHPRSDRAIVSSSPEGFVSALSLLRDSGARSELEAVIGRQSTRAQRTITTAIAEIAREGELDRREKELVSAALEDSRQNAEALRRAINGLTQGIGGGKGVATA